MCDGCGESLCEQCVEEGHRLLFCRVCGERALPLAADGPATSRELAGERKRFAAYSWSEALAYPVRGKGAFVFWSYPAVIVALTVVSQVPLLGILGGCAQLFLSLAVLLVLPGALFAVVRTTAQGETELPDWPDFFEFGSRVNEVFEFILVGMLALMPLALALRAAGCGVSGSLSGACLAILVIGSTLAIAVWVPAFGSVAAYRKFWLALRFDLHARAAAATPRPFLGILAAAAALMVIGQAIALFLLGVVPLLGVAISAVVGLYSWFTIAHLVGLWFRRHEKELRKVYCG